MSSWAEYGDGPIILHGRRRMMIVISATIVPRQNAVHRPDTSRLAPGPVVMMKI